MFELRAGIALATAAAATLILSPAASADPDPHIPNANENYCPGGQRSDYGGIKYCLGISFPSGAFYAQRGGFGAAGPFGPWRWGNGATCMVMVDGTAQYFGPSGGVPNCGGPQSIEFG